MKRLLTFLLVFLLALTLLMARVDNSEQPLKGKWDFAPQKLWESEFAGDDVLVNVAAIRIDRDGRIFVYDRKYFKFFVFSPRGEFLFSFGQRGEGPGEYRMVSNFHLVENHVVVPDMNKIHFFNLKGDFVRSELPGGNFIIPRVFIDLDRFITVPMQPEDPNAADKLEIFNLKSKKRTTLAEFSPEENLEASVSTGGRQMRLVVRDNSTSPGIVVTHQDGYLYFGRSDRYLIRKTDLSGKELLSFSLQGRERRPITEAMKKARFENLVVNGRKPSEEMLKQLTAGIPDVCTYFNRIQVLDNGMIMVFIPDLGNPYGSEADIFSPDGRYLYHAELRLPEGYRMNTGTLTISGDTLTVFAEDEEGENHLARYRIQLPE